MTTLPSHSREELLKAIVAKEEEIAARQKELQELKQLLHLFPAPGSPQARDSIGSDADGGFATAPATPLQEASSTRSQNNSIFASLQSLGANRTSTGSGTDDSQSRPSSGEHFTSVQSESDGPNGGSSGTARPVDPILASIRAAQQKSENQKPIDPALASIRAAQATRSEEKPLDPIMASIRNAQQKPAEGKAVDPVMSSIRAAQQKPTADTGDSKVPSAKAGHHRPPVLGEVEALTTHTADAASVASAPPADPIMTSIKAAQQKSHGSEEFDNGISTTVIAQPISGAPPTPKQSGSFNGAQREPPTPKSNHSAEAFQGSANFFQQMGAAFHRAASQEEAHEHGGANGGPRTWTGAKAAFHQQSAAGGWISRSFSVPTAPSTGESSSEDESVERSSEVSQPHSPAGGPAGNRPSSPLGRPSSPRARRSSGPLTLFQYHVHLRMGKREYAIVADIRWDLAHFRQHLAEDYELVFQGTDEGDGCWSTILHGIDHHGDVTVISSPELYTDFKDMHLQSADHEHLAPMELAILEKGEDVLSLVKIPAGEHCPHPMHWKQGKLLGKGAFGAVHMAMKSDGEIIAVKRIETKAGAELLESFETESKLLQKLKHRNVVRFIGSKVVAHSLAAIWMEYVPGGSVANILQVFGAMAEELVRHYTKQILLGLEYLHEAGVIHRDLKPGNILVTVDGVVKLSDFGASVQSTKTKGEQQFAMAGTPNYIAPEMLRSQGNKGYSFNIDIWSLGMTVIEMLTAEMPFDDFTNPFAIMFQIAKLEEPPEIPDYFSSGAKSFLNRCLQTDPEKRPGATGSLKHTFVGGPGDDQELEAKKAPPTPSSRFKRTKALRKSGNLRTSSQGTEDVPGQASGPDIAETRAGSDSRIHRTSFAESSNRRHSTSSLESGVSASVSSDDSHPETERRADPVAGPAPDEPAAIMYQNRTSPNSSKDIPADRAIDGMRRHNSEAVLKVEIRSSSLEAGHTDSVPVTVDASPISATVDKDLPPNRPIPTPPSALPPPAPMLKSQSENFVISDPPAHSKVHAKGAVKRFLEPVPVETPSPAVWQFFDHKEWKSYSEEHCRIIEAGHQDKIDKVDLNLATDSKWGTQYTIDLKTMEQINVASGFKRAIRRTSGEQTNRNDSAPSTGSKSNKIFSDSAPKKNVNVGVIPTTMEQLTTFLRQKASVEHEAAKGLKGSFRHAVKRIVRSGEVAYRKKERTVADLQHQIDVLKQEMESSQGARRDFIQRRFKKATEELEKATAALRDTKKKMESDYSADPGLAPIPSTAEGDETGCVAQGKPSEAPKKAPWKASRNFHATVKAPVVPRPVARLSSSSHLPPQALETAQLVPSAMVLPGGLYEGWEVVCGLLVGNAYNGPVTHSSDSMGGKETLLHSWTVFVRSQEGRPLSLVKKVSFTFWPLKSSQATTVLASEPFAIKRCSSAAFDISIDIQMQGPKNFKILHYLCLTKSGEWSDDRNSTESDCFPVTKYVLCVKAGSVPE